MTQEDQLASISNATLLQTQSVLELKATLTQMVTNATNQFTATIARVVELNKVDNVADAKKAISELAWLELNKKQATLVSGQNISTVNGMSLLSGDPLAIERSATSLRRITYDNRGVLRTPVLTPQVDDSTLVESLGLFMWINTKLEPDDDETCFTTETGQWLLQAPAWDLVDAWISQERAVTDDWREDEPIRFAAYLLANK